MAIYYDTRFFIETKGRIDVLKKFLNNFPSKMEKDYKQKDIKKMLSYNKIIIKIRNLSFKYNANKPVFQNFDLTLNNNQSTAIIGGIGSGKSSLSFLDV